MAALRRKLAIPRIGNQCCRARRHLTQDRLDWLSWLVREYDLQCFDKRVDVVATRVKLECSLRQMPHAAQRFYRCREARGCVFVRGEAPEQSKFALEGCGGPCETGTCQRRSRHATMR